MESSILDQRTVCTTLLDSEVVVGILEGAVLLTFQACGVPAISRFAFAGCGSMGTFRKYIVNQKAAEIAFVCDVIPTVLTITLAGLAVQHACREVNIAALQIAEVGYGIIHEWGDTDLHHATDGGIYPSVVCDARTYAIDGVTDSVGILRAVQDTFYSGIIP